MIITIDLKDNIRINGKTYVLLIKQNGIQGKTWKKWNQAQDRQLIKLVDMGLNVAQCAEKMHRTIPAITKRIRIIYQAKNAKKSGSEKTG